MSRWGVFGILVFIAATSVLIGTKEPANGLMYIIAGATVALGLHWALSGDR